MKSPGVVGSESSPASDPEIGVRGRGAKEALLIIKLSPCVPELGLFGLNFQQQLAKGGYALSLQPLPVCHLPLSFADQGARQGSLAGFDPLFERRKRGISFTVELASDEIVKNVVFRSHGFCHC